MEAIEMKRDNLGVEASERSTSPVTGGGGCCSSLLRGGAQGLSLLGRSRGWRGAADALG